VQLFDRSKSSPALQWWPWRRPPSHATPGLLNDQVTVFLHQIAQLAGLPLFVESLKGPVFGRVAHPVDRVLQHESVQIVLEGVSDQNLFPETKEADTANTFA